MKIQVFYYKADGSFDYTGLIDAEYSDNGELILPPMSTDIFPPSMDTEPIFKGGKWVETKSVPPQEPVPPSVPLDEVFEDRISALEKANEELSLKVTNLNRTVSQMSTDLQNTRYYLQVVFPHVKHYFGG